MCGVFGAVVPRGSEPTDAAAIATLGLFALQHRGQESAGIAVSDGDQLMLYKDLGMISTVLDERRLPSLRGGLAIAHCRYSTTGSTIWENAQPTYRRGPRRAIAIGHNGNLVNTRDLLTQLEGGRARLPASTDTELLTALLADEPATDTVQALVQVLPRVRGAFTLVILDERRVIGVRDPHGFRPLVLGKLPRPQRTGRPGRRPVDRRRRLGRLVPLVGDRRARHRRRGVRPRRGAGRDRDPRARACAPLGPLRPRIAGAVRVRAHLLRPPRLVHGGAQPVRGPAPDGRAARPRAPGRGRPGHARPRHRRAGGRGVRGGVGPAVPRGHVSQPLRRADLHPALAGAAPSRRDDQAQPAPRGRQREEADRRRRLDRPRDDHQADRRAAAQGRRDRGPRPDQRPADLPPVLLRHRHLDRDRADRGHA